MMRDAKARWVNPMIALALGALYVGWLVATASDLGYARDEGFYFQAARTYRDWFGLLFSEPSVALEASVRDRYWRANAEHPAFVKSLFVLSHWLFHEQLGWFSNSGGAYRFVGMLSGGGMVGLLFLWGSAVVNRWAGVVAALAFALLPRVFFHAHLSCFDVPVAFLWFLVCYAYYRALSSKGWGWAIATGVLFGCLLNTKHNSWLLPPVVFVHYGLVALHARAVGARLPGLSLPRALICMALLGPLVFLATWPWLWSQPWQRLVAYAQFHLNHAYYNMEFLGRTYYEPPMPRLYAWLMTLATVPATTLLLFALGVARAVRESLARGWLPFGDRWLPGAVRRRLLGAPELAPARFSHRYSAYLLWGLGLLAGYAPWWSSETPIFGGTKHWLTAYPFMALFAGFGFEWVVRRWREVRLPSRIERWIPYSVLAVLVLPALVMTWSSHPFGLSAYTPLVGGAPGAAGLGLNRTFWGYTTGSLEGDINQRVAGGAALYLHDTARASFDAMKRDARIRNDIRGTLDIARSENALYHHEPHMSRVEYQIWVDYGTLRPSVVVAHHGVPVVWMYDRPAPP